MALRVRAMSCREQMQQQARTKGRLFDHLVGAGEHRGRQIEAERLGGLMG